MPWDGHSDIGGNHRIAARSVDQPIGALLADLKQRGMLDNTLVIWGGEFGRTSDSQGSKGRDHNPNALQCGWRAAELRAAFNTERVTSSVIRPSRTASASTISTPRSCTRWGLDHEKLTYRFNGRDYRLTDVAGQVIRELLV